jgi:hypothetical protein
MCIYDLSSYNSFQENLIGSDYGFRFAIQLAICHIQLLNIKVLLSD